MGGLFQAQNQQLQQILPDVQAKATAAGTGSGQFGSLRSETARDKAVGDAQANLLTAQMQAALQNQQTGSQAAANLGTVANQGITAETNLGQLQQSDPYAASSALTKILGGLTVGNTVSNATQYSPLAQVTSLGGAMQGGLNALNATSAGSSLLKNLGLDKLISGSAQKLTLPGGGSMSTGLNGSQIYTDVNGIVTGFKPDGTMMNSADSLAAANIIPDSTGPLTDAGSDTSWIDDFDWDSLFN
jgi:hypothetical protein